MFRKTIAEKVEANKNYFRFRGHEVRRIEAFSDAVFAFAVTLLIVSLEVPKSFEELMTTIRGFFAFGVSFALLMLVWYEQNIFFRRYGLDDLKTIVLNCILIFLVLFYVYPLKFLFTLIFSSQIYLSQKSPLAIQQNDVPHLMIIYALGYILIYLMFILLYLHALKKAKEMDLTDIEKFETKTKLFKDYILVAIGFLSILVALIVSPAQAGIAGLVYVLIGPALSFYYAFRAKKRRKLFITAD